MPIIFIDAMTLPKPTGEFEWTQESWGPALRCTALANAAQHCFSTLPPGLSGAPREDAGSLAALAHALNLHDAKSEQIVRLRQVHRAGVFDASREAIAGPGHADWPEADITVSRDSSLVLTVRAADCVPVLLADRATGAVSAIHAGWRGTAAGAVLAAVQALSEKFGTEPANIVAAVGPAIGPCCYTVGEELVQKFAAHSDAPRWFNRAGGLRLDLWQATRDQLERSGVAPRNIHVSQLCTFEHAGVFPSYRRDGKAAGRLTAAIRPHSSS
jgi:purine-nucleoside/S-methyl-5'-thioadenosine phosphorylase / adenosine deaminase